MHESINDGIVVKNLGIKPTITKDQILDDCELVIIVENYIVVIYENVIVVDRKQLVRVYIILVVGVRGEENQKLD